jgi:hypothetical protein
MPRKGDCRHRHADCHPDRPHKARGLCDNFYRRLRRRERAPPKPRASMERPLCRLCGVRPAAPKYPKGPTPRWRTTCNTCQHRGRLNSYEERRKKQRAAFVVGRPCERCGFVPEHPCQMDLDHRDGDHTNNDPANLAVLCARCHRLKTLQNRDMDSVRPLVVDPTRPRCRLCGIRSVERYRLAKGNRVVTRTTCEACSKPPGSRANAAKRRRERQRALLHALDPCPRCGFVPAHACQMDIDHIDGNHGNDDPANLQCLCANCHRLKTHYSRDWAGRAAPARPDE